MSKTPPFSIIRPNTRTRKGNNIKQEAIETLPDAPIIESVNFKASLPLMPPTRYLPQRSNSKYANQKNDQERYNDLISQYQKASHEYRNEEFTQQSEIFLSRISSDKKIPKELASKFPIFHILVTVSKIFLLNEFEIAALGNILDYVNWKYEELILPGEASYLSSDFLPLNLNFDLSDDCKRFIIYLLLIAFSVKQFLNEPSEFEKIKVHCEKICQNLPILFNRWIRATTHKYNLAEMNKKFKALCKKDFGEDAQNIKDYNVIVDSIMSLTGSYASKKSFETASSDFPIRNNAMPFNPEMYSNFDNQIPLGTEKFEIQTPSLSKAGSKVFEPGISNDMIKIPTVVNKPSGIFSRSFSNEFQYQNPVFQQNKSKEEFDYNQTVKKFKTGTNGYLRSDSLYNIFNLPNLLSSNSQYKQNSEYDDNMNIPLPQLGKQSSNVSQGPDDLPSFSRFGSTFSAGLDK